MYPESQIVTFLFCQLLLDTKMVETYFCVVGDFSFTYGALYYQLCWLSTIKYITGIKISE